MKPLNTKLASTSSDSVGSEVGLVGYCDGESVGSVVVGTNVGIEAIDGECVVLVGESDGTMLGTLVGIVLGE